MFELKKTDELEGFRFADFFAGIGGFHIALAARGARCVFACEKDRRAADVYQRNFGIRPDGDIAQIVPKDVPSHDILTAGFPCQPFSRAGKGLGLDDPRGKLIWDLLRIVEHHKPPIVLLENVPGLLSHAKGQTFAIIRTAIERLGYVVHTQIINAAESWVPQNRERVFILCFRTDIAPARFATVLPSLFNYTVADVVEDYLDRDVSAIERPFSPSTPYVEDRRSDGDAKKLQRLGGYGKQRQGMRVYDANGRGVTLGSQGGGAGALTGLYKLPGGNIRRLTKLEAQRMAGFPDSFVAHENEITAQRQFGNAVVPTAVARVLVTVTAAFKDAGLRPVAEVAEGGATLEGEASMAGDKKSGVTPEGSAAVRLSSRRLASMNDAALTHEQETELADCAKRILALGRKSTSQAFEYGRELARAQALLPPKRFGSWLKANCGMSTKSAKNYTRVHKELTAHRHRLEKTGMAPTMMFALLGVDDNAIGEVLDIAEKGERLTVREVKALVSANKTISEKEYPPIEVGGVRGLARRAEIKMKADQVRFLSAAGRLLAKVEEMVKAKLEGRNIASGTKVTEIVEDARQAHEVLQSLIGPAVVDGHDGDRSWLLRPSSDGITWDIVQRTVHRLSVSDTFISEELLTIWLMTEAYPALIFAIRGEANPQTKANRSDNDAEDTSLPYEPTENEWRAIHAQIAYVMARLGSAATHNIESDLRAMIVDGYRKVGELNASADRASKPRPKSRRAIHQGERRSAY